MSSKLYHTKKNLSRLRAPNPSLSCWAFFHAPYMRQVMDIAFAEGNRLHVPVILETDAQSKCDKYVHLGMQLAGKRSLGAYGALYDLVKEPE